MKKFLFASLFFLAITGLTISCKKHKVTATNPTSDATELTVAFKPVKGDNAATKDIALTDFRKLASSKFTPKKITVTKGSQINVSGLQGSVSLSNLTLQLKTNPAIKRNLGSVAKDQVFNSAEDLAFLQKVADEMLKTKTTKLDVLTTSSDKLSADVKVVIKLNANFL